VCVGTGQKWSHRRIRRSEARPAGKPCHKGGTTRHAQLKTKTTSRNVHTLHGGTLQGGMGNTLAWRWKGKTDADNDDQHLMDGTPRCGQDTKGAFFVHVRKGGQNVRGTMTTWNDGQCLGTWSSHDRDLAKAYNFNGNSRRTPGRRREKKGGLSKVRGSIAKRWAKRHVRTSS
jgi:hypothetical protein